MFKVNSTISLSNVVDDCCGGCCCGCVVAASNEKLSSDINPSFVSVIDVLIASETMFFKVSTTTSSDVYDTYTVTVPSSSILTTTSVGSIPVSLLTLFLIISISIE